MNSLLKYDLLNTSEKQEVDDFIDFLLNRKAPSQPAYKDKILSVSVWSKKDIEVLKNGSRHFNL